MESNYFDRGKPVTAYLMNDDTTEQTETTTGENTGRLFNIVLEIIQVHTEKTI